MNNIKNKIEYLFGNNKLNPLKCESTGLMCDPVIFYIIGMTLLLVFMFIINYCKRNKLFSLITIFINIFVFIGCLIILINLCIYKKPTIYSYIIIFISVLTTYLINKSL
jgi:hypothetical protein